MKSFKSEGRVSVLGEKFEEASGTMRFSWSNDYFEVLLFHTITINKSIQTKAISLNSR
jgi:hypothetical protein